MSTNRKIQPIKTNVYLIIPIPREQAGLDTTAAFEFKAVDGGYPDPNLVQFLRLTCLSGADLFLLEPVFRNEIWDFMGFPVSESNERAVGELIQSRCQEGLAELNAAATEADDAEAVASGDESPSGQRKRAVAAVRRGERVALTASLGWWQRDLELLNLKEYYQVGRVY